MHYLGLDYGERYLGVAIGEGTLATPLPSINCINWETAASELVKIISNNQVKAIILGLPLSRGGELTTQALGVKKFGTFIEKRLRLPVTYFDEADSSKEAQERSLELGDSAKSRRHLDSLAAAIILERYLVDLGKEVGELDVRS